jgi:hypothetical protein
LLVSFPLISLRDKRRQPSCFALSISPHYEFQKQEVQTAILMIE